MRPIVLRPIILAASVLAAACSDHVSSSPTSPTSVALASTQTQRSATRLPLRGSFTGTGTFNLTAANGDQLFATTAGGEDEFTPPNVSHVTLVATIAGGTGRFASATGTFTIERTGIINFATGTSTSTGSFDGQISLNN